VTQTARQLEHRSSPTPARAALMIRPVWFEYNQQTAETNAFQHRPSASPDELLHRAQREFDGLAGALQDAGVHVIVVDDSHGAFTPDALFPNNWISFHDTGHAIIYPMAVPVRRAEVRPELIDVVEERLGVRWPHRVDLTPLADDEHYLEGTGSVVIDHQTRTAYACRSLRTSKEGLDAFAEAAGYDPVLFDAFDESGTPYYHTNVMMSVGTDYAAVCIEAIPEADRPRVVGRLEEAGKTIVPLTRVQTAKFAGNMIELASRDGRTLLVMSQQARVSLTSEQTAVFESLGEIVSSDLSTIEFVAGGSARCMIASIHTPAT
jgi:hypothetical protein